MGSGRGNCLVLTPWLSPNYQLPRPDPMVVGGPRGYRSDGGHGSARVRSGALTIAADGAPRGDPWIPVTSVSPWAADRPGSHVPSARLRAAPPYAHEAGDRQDPRP